MKNLRVGARIIISYAIIVFMMIVSAAAVTISSLATIKDINHIKINAQTEMMGKALSDNLVEARLNTKIICYVINDEAYNSAKDNLESCRNMINQMRTHIGENPILESLRTYVDKVEITVDEYEGYLDSLQLSNSKLSVLMTEIDGAGAALTEISDSMDTENLNAIYNSAYLELTEEKTRLADILAESASVSQHIWNIRKNARVMMMDGSGYENYDLDLMLLDETIEIVEKSRSSSEKILDLQKELKIYKDLIITFRDEMNLNTLTAENCAACGNIMLETINNMMINIDSAMNLIEDESINAAYDYLAMIICIAVVSIAVSAVLAVFTSKSITNPVKEMLAAANKISEGNMEVTLDYVSENEIGKLARALKKMIIGIREEIAVVESIADGDFTVKAEPRCGEDKMGFALVKMLENLNRMFGEIDTASSAVFKGSKQIDEGSQTLAEGSTEQAAAVEQLSSSMTEIAEKTKVNAEMAAKAAALADNIIVSAERGSRQMDEMMTAVKDINNASQSISKVIKVIDDIAFQTNILALNAAVEAARAGQHGKGFAVVAEEVRNLAAKSAEAAKETGGLIENSIEKAGLGAKIADETAASLEEIVSGIKESNRLARDIARSSEEQTAGISQVNTGISQVAQVIQQNSATAQEAAAASDDMTAQVTLLNRLFERFKFVRNSKPAEAYPVSRAFEKPDKHIHAITAAVKGDKYFN